MKNIFASKTFWFNVLTIVIAVATYSGFTPNQDVSNIATATLLSASPFVNLVLRWFTNKAVVI